MSARVRPHFTPESVRRECAARDTATTNYAGQPLRVAVKVIGEGTSARASTFYFASPTSARQYVYRRDDA